MKALKTGSTGDLVKYLQKKLISLNYTNVAVNGTFDSNTDTAVRDFQGHNALTVDGIIGGNTWIKIYVLTEPKRDGVPKTDRHNNIMHLHPTVRVAVVKVFVQLQAEGIPFRIFEAFRYPERQNALYAQGRTKPGNIVTYAKAWSSYHQYGLAVDFVLLINNEWSWSDAGSKAAWWKRMHELATEEGLMRLNFEIPHVQLANTSAEALRHGVYPPGGDKSWHDNMMAALGKV